MIKVFKKLMPINESGPDRRQMAVAFIAGMAITAILAQTPAAASIFAPRVIHEPVAPALPATPDSLKTGNRPDTINPAEPCELVYAITKDSVPPC